jgi:FMN phosphatase YigB (HAD superfamily)
MKETIARLLEVWDRNVDVSHVEQLELVVRYVSNGSLTLKNEWIEELSMAYVSPFFEIPPHLNPDAMSVLESLTECGKRIGLICNTGLTPGFALREFLDSEEVLKHFDFLAFSDEIGFRKPDARVFHLVARKLEADPCSIVHVGDNLMVDVWGAKNAGFKAVHFACDAGRDKIAEADPTSLVTRSREVGIPKKEQAKADKTIASFNMITEVIEQLEKEAQT